MYIDSFKVVNQNRRPLAQRVASIPATWLFLLKCVATLSIVTNTVILFNNAGDILRLVGIPPNGYEKWVAAFVFEHAVLLFVATFFTAIPNEPKGHVQLKNLQKRIQRAVLVGSKGEHDVARAQSQDADAQARARRRAAAAPAAGAGAGEDPRERAALAAEARLGAAARRGRAGKAAGPKAE